MPISMVIFFYSFRGIYLIQKLPSTLGREPSTLPRYHPHSRRVRRALFQGLSGIQCCLCLVQPCDVDNGSQLRLPYSPMAFRLRLRKDFRPAGTDPAHTNPGFAFSPGRLTRFHHCLCGINSWEDYATVLSRGQT